MRGLNGAAAVGLGVFTSISGSVTSIPSPEGVVRRFYNHIVRYHPLGIPEGKDKRTLWPLLSRKASRLLDTARECQEDYFRRHRGLPNASELKAELGWLEAGLFSGLHEKARPSAVSIGHVSTISADLVRVDLQFTYRDTYQQSYVIDWNGAALVGREGDRYAIDEIILIDEKGNERHVLAEAFPECNGAQWIPEPGR
jgi:hypothetical protein